MATERERLAAPGSRRLGRLLLTLLLAAALLLTLLRVLAPLALEAIAERRLGEALGAPVEIGDLDFELLQAGMAVDALRIGAPGTESGSPPVLALERATLKLDRGALAERRLQIEVIVLDGLALELHRNAEGGLELRLGGSDDASEETPASDATVALPFGVERVLLREARVSVEGEPAPRARLAELELRAITPGEAGVTLLGSVRAEGELALGTPGAGAIAARLRATASELAFPATRPFPVELELEIPEAEGKLRAEGSLGLAPLAAEFVLAIESLELPPLLAALSPSSPAPLRGGLLTGQLDLATQEDGRSLRVGGALDVAGLALGAPDEAFSLEQGALALRLGSVRVPLAAEGPTRVALESATLRGARLRVVRESPSGAAAAEAEPAEGESGLRLTIGALRVEEALFTVVDRTLEPAFEVPLTDLEVDARELGWPPLRIGSLELTAQGLGSEPLRVTGSIAPGETRLAVVARRVPLLLVDPYVETASSYRLDGGAASLESELTLAPERFRAPTKLVLHELALGAPEGVFQQQFGVPLDLALALLKDLSGDITLELPIEGSGEGAGVSLLKVVGRALRGALLNALASPVKLLGAVLLPGEGAGYSLAPVRFAPGDAALSEEARQRLGSAAALLARRPQLRVSVRPHVTQPDLEVLAAAGGDALDPAALAERRAAHVREALLAVGLEASRVTTEVDDDRAGVPRVELRVGAG